MIYNQPDMETLIQPKILKGFRDFLPQDEMLRAELIEKITGTYRSYGFVPIDTPVLEYTEILLRKSNGETEKQMFRFLDNGGRDVALRFDLTVPFARFIAQHKNELYFPFKRYHVAKVWRGEKPQSGRYREFVQCDFDIVGSDSAISDFETVSLMKEALAAISVENITIRINHRGIFNRFLEQIGCKDKSEDILRAVDKIAKTGAEQVSRELSEITGSSQAASRIIEYIQPLASFEETLSHIETLAGGESDDTKRMRAIHTMMQAAGIEKSYVLDPSITRGLDYYTGIVYETFLNDLPSLGSVCSGGRYDNLAGLYMKERLPGVGASIGLDRLIAGLTELGITSHRGSFLDAIVFNGSEELAAYCQLAAGELRKKGLSVEVYPDADKMGRQYGVAEKKGIPWGILADKEDEAAHTVTLKNLKNRETYAKLNPEQAADIIRKAQKSNI